MKKIKILSVLGSGGHTAQMLLLLHKLGNDNFDYEYAINDDDVLSEKKVEGTFYRITNPRGPDDRMGIAKVLTCTLHCLRAVLRSRPDVIISAGPGLSVPLFLVGKLFGIKSIFLESWSRSQTKSKSGKYCYYLSDLFFVQWPDMKHNYPKAIYAGRMS